MGALSPTFGAPLARRDSMLSSVDEARLWLASSLLLVGSGCSGGSRTDSQTAGETAGGGGASSGADSDGSAGGLRRERPQRRRTGPTSGDAAGGIPTVGGIFRRRNPGRRTSPGSRRIRAPTPSSPLSMRRAVGAMATSCKSTFRSCPSRRCLDSAADHHRAGGASIATAGPIATRFRCRCPSRPTGTPKEAPINLRHRCRTTTASARRRNDEKKLYEIYNATQAGSAFTALGAFVWDLTKAYPDNLRGDQCTSADGRVSRWRTHPHGGRSRRAGR